MGPTIQKFITDASRTSERNGTSLPTTPIPSRIERHIGGLAPAAGATGGSGSLHKAAMMNRKLIASIKKAQAMPKAFMTIPAGAGVAMVVICAVPCTTENVATICSRGTRDGRKACDAGPAKASATPKAKASAYRYQS